MKKLFTLAICSAFVAAVVLGSMVLGQPAFASNGFMAQSQPTSYVEPLKPPVALAQPDGLNTTAGWLIAQASLTEEEMEAKAKEGAPQGAILDESQVAEFECQTEGFYPNPDDRQKFIRCVDYGVGYGVLRFDFDCAPGTDLWCQELLTCSFDFQCPSSHSN